MTGPETPAREFERLAALYETELLDTPPDERFDRVTRLCRRLLGVDMALVNLIDEDRQWTKSVAGGEGLEISRRLSVCAQTIQEPDGLEVEDLSADPRFAAVPYVVGDPRLRFYAGVPLATTRGHRVGTLCVADRRPRRLSSGDRELLRDLGLWAEQELSREDALGRAAAIQGSLFPTRAPWDDAWEVAGGCRPSPEVGGDFYDWQHGPDATVVALGEVVGHGMPAAIAMAVVRSALRAATRDEADPAVALGRAAADLAAERTVTRTTGVLVLALRGDGSVAAGDAAHGRAHVVDPDGTVRPLASPGAALRGADAAAYGPTTVRLDEGAAVVAYGAGLTLADGAAPTPAAVATLVAGAGSAEEAVERLLGAAGRRTRADDVTVVAARRRAAWSRAA